MPELVLRRVHQVKLFIDPGIRGSGASIFRGTAVYRAAYVPNPARHGNGVEEVRAMARAIQGWWYANGVDVPEHFGCERPQIYTQSKQRVKGRATDPNDLPPLYGIDCAVAALFPGTPCYAYWPRDWKGTLDGDAMIERIKTRVSSYELSCIDLSCGPNVEHNIWDAIGIGMKHVGRLERKRVIAR